MPKNVLRGLSVILGVLFLYGCAATENVEVRRYIEVKDRLDQNMEGGNAGFIMGAPQPEDRSNFKKTRKIYVVEVSKGPNEEEDVVVENNAPAVEKAPAFKEERMNANDIEEEDMDYGSQADIDEGEMMGTTTSQQKTTDRVSKPASSYVEYTVQKDDTLQKISKKFYDSYSKWPKIYEVNKNVISNPDRIKPGITIQIPME